jgi:hypothetical protein
MAIDILCRRSTILALFFEVAAMRRLYMSVMNSMTPVCLKYDFSKAVLCSGIANHIAYLTVWRL